MKKIILCFLLLYVSNAYSLQIVGEFKGWKDRVVVKLTDGTCWQQAYYYYYYYYFLYPSVTLIEKGGSIFMKVEGCPEIEVRQVSCSNYNSEIDNETNTNSGTNYSYTYLNIQNNTDKTLYYCYVVYTSSYGWQSNGWFKVEAYSNNMINIGYYTGKIYVYAEYNSGESCWGDNSSKYSFCIDKANAFNIPNSDTRTCTESNYKRVKMAEFSITPGVFTWTLTP